MRSVPEASLLRGRTDDDVLKIVKPNEVGRCLSAVESGVVFRRKKVLPLFVFPHFVHI